jgi:hypothetical protein
MKTQPPLSLLVTANWTKYLPGLDEYDTSIVTRCGAKFLHCAGI